jgi:hypothetical protein
MSIKAIDDALGVKRPEAVEAEIVDDESMIDMADIQEADEEREAAGPPVPLVDIECYEEVMNSDDNFVDEQLRGIITQLGSMTTGLKEAIEETMERTGINMDTRDIDSFTKLLNAQMTAVKQISTVNESRKKRVQKEISDRRRAVTKNGVSVNTDANGNANADIAPDGRRIVSRSELLKAGKKNITRAKDLLKPVDVPDETAN